MSTTALSRVGARRLAEAEATIESGLKTFWEVGNALMQIRDERLYRADFSTFEDYCQERWGMTRRRANQLVEAVRLGTVVPILTERQARALAPLAEDPAELREIWAEAERRGDTSGPALTRLVVERTENATHEGSGDDGPDSEGDAGSCSEPAPATGPLDAASGDGADSHDVGRPEPEPDSASPTTTPSGSESAPKVAPVPALRLMADLSARRAEVAKWLAFDRHEQVIDSMTAEQRGDYRRFLLSVFNHASATMDYLDAPARLKAVR